MRAISLLLCLVSLTARASEHGGGGGEAAKAEAPKAEAAHVAEEVDPGLAVRAAKQSSRDVKIPRALVSLLEKDYRAYLVANKLPAQEGLKRKLLDVSVEMRQRRPAALQEDVRINTPIGGGVVDLAEFVTPLKGAFHMLIKPRSEGTELGVLRVFYVSHAKSRLIARENFGAGCGKFMEVTKYFNKKMSRDGFELYTADQRYLSVVGGTFVLAAFAPEALQMASLNFTDSRYTDLLCE